MKYSKRLQPDDEIDNLPKYMIGNMITSPFRMADEVVKKTLLFKKKTQLKMLKICLILSVIIFVTYTILATLFRTFNVFICTGILFTIMFYLVLMFVVKNTNEVKTVYRTGLEDDDKESSLESSIESSSESTDELSEETSELDDFDKLFENNNEEKSKEELTEKEIRIKQASDNAKAKLKNFQQNGIKLCTSANTSIADLMKASPERAISDEMNALYDMGGHTTTWDEIYTSL